MSNFPPCQVLEEVQQEPSQSSVLKNKINQNLRWRIPLSPRVEHIQVYQSTKSRAARERGEEHGARLHDCQRLFGDTYRLALHSPWFVFSVSFTPPARRLGSDPTGHSALFLS